MVGADASAITTLRDKIREHRARISKIPTLADTMIVLATGFAITGIAHVGADLIAPWLTRIGEKVEFIERMSLGSPFFWLVVLATTGGVAVSFTRARELEGVGASRVGSVFIWILVATIGMNMDLMAILEYPGVFLVGFIWIGFHAVLLIAVGLAIKAPFFFLAVGSQANVGGAASAPVMASAFHPSLAPVGVLLAVLGYALGTYAAWFCGLMMQAVAP